jgi:predicted Rossmann fold nucleotide-binding protein DprA/Smf involved in DNA uptake
MDLSGNKDLLDRELVAFFASRKATPHDTQLALQWAESICQTDKVVISGFHSPLEKEILNYLLERRHPVIFALGRALYKKVPPHLQSPFDEGRLLFVSFRGYSRHSWNSAQIRNWSVSNLAEEVYFTQFDETSSLSTLHYTFKHYGSTPVHILE